MFDSIKKTLLASLGAVAFTHEKLQGVVDDLVSRGELTREQGKKLFDTLISRGKVEGEEISSRLFSETQSLRDLFPITRAEFQRLNARVERLESMLGAEPVTEESPPGDPLEARPAAADISAGLPEEYPGEALPPSDPD